MSEDAGAAFGFTITPVLVLLIDLVAAAPAGDCPYDGELEELFVVEGEGTAFRSFVPFSRVTGFAVSAPGVPAVPFEADPPGELFPAPPPPVPAAPAAPPPPPLPPPPPPPWAHAGHEAVTTAATITAVILVRMASPLIADKAAIKDTFLRARWTGQRPLLKSAEVGQSLSLQSKVELVGRSISAWLRAPNYGQGAKL